MSNREEGDDYAEDICCRLNSNIIDADILGFKITKNSGATHRDCDMKTQKYAIDCKYSESPKKSIPTKDIKKTCEQAEKSGRIGITVVKTDIGDVACLMLNDLAGII